LYTNNVSSNTLFTNPVIDKPESRRELVEEARYVAALQDSPSPSKLASLENIIGGNGEMPIAIEHAKISNRADGRILKSNNGTSKSITALIWNMHANATSRKK
jgi:hypothetical protein